MKQEQSLNRHTTFTFMILVPIFLMVSLLSSKIYDARKQDFGAYWQAGHMILSGQNVYDSSEWIAERELRKTALHSEPTFQYPLPFAILFAPLALIPIQSAYTLWMFFAQVAILTSIVLLLDFYPARSGYFELLTIAGIFLFRPTYSVIANGQSLSLLLLLVTLSIYLFHKKHWFWSGLLLSFFSLKPSIGILVLVLAGMWLVSKKQWMGILGVAAGGIGLFLLGGMVNPHWVTDYIRAGGNSFAKYYGMHPTLWGAVDKMFIINKLSMTIAAVCVIVVLVIEAYLFWGNKSDNEPVTAFAGILPAALLIAPYSWNYDQILLTVPIVFLLTRISIKWGSGKAVIFLFGVVAFAVALVSIAYLVRHDVWSFLNSLVVWVFILYFAAKGS